MREDDFVTILENAGIKVLAGIFKMAGGFFRVHEDSVTEIGTTYPKPLSFESFVVLNGQQLRKPKP